MPWSREALYGKIFLELARPALEFALHFLSKSKQMAEEK
jgi:hypothetical protein